MLKVNGRIDAPVTAVLLHDWGIEGNPWQAYTKGGSSVEWIDSDQDDHLVFLAKYKKQISDTIRRYANVEEK